MIAPCPAAARRCAKGYAPDQIEGKRITSQTKWESPNYDSVFIENARVKPTTARRPQPWCLRHRTCKLLPFSRGLWQTVAFLRTPGSCAFGGLIGIGWKGTRILISVSRRPPCLFTTPRSAHPGPRPIAPRPRDTPRRRLSGRAFGAASVARSGLISRRRPRPLRQARPWLHPVSGAHEASLPGPWMALQ